MTPKLKNDWKIALVFVICLNDLNIFYLIDIIKMSKKIMRFSVLLILYHRCFCKFDENSRIILKGMTLKLFGRKIDMTSFNFKKKN